MADVSFALDGRAWWIGALFLIGAYFLYRWQRSQPQPSLKFSHVDALETPSSVGRFMLKLPRFLEYASLGLFLLAFLNPNFYIPLSTSETPKITPEPLEGIAIYLILDQSRSMTEKIEARMSDGSRRNLSKIDLLRSLTTQFVQERPNDLIGLIGFSRGAQVLEPLTLDHQAILNQLKQFSVQLAKDQDGTSIGYAIYKTASLIAATRNYAQNLKGAGQPAYDLKSAIMILVTDGIQEPNPLDKEKKLRNIDIPEAAEYAKQLGVRLYIVNIEPGFASSEFEPNRRQMQSAAEETGGKFYLIDQGGNGLAQIYDEIDKLEKSRLPQQNEIQQLEQKVPKSELPHLYRRIPLYVYLAAAGLLALFISVVLQSTLMRRVP